MTPPKVLGGVIQKDHFVLHGEKYVWKTLGELKKDPKVREKNMDIVSFVESLPQTKNRI